MGITTANARQIDAMVALSVFGRAANSGGPGADISTTGSSGAVLRESGGSLAFGTIATAGIANSAVTYAKIQNVSAQFRILGRISSGAGVVEELTEANVNTIVGRAALTLATGAFSVTGSTASFTGGNVDITRSASGASVSVTVSNTNTAASSAALLDVIVAGGSAGDASAIFRISGGEAWALGLDNSASDAFVLANSSALGTTNVLSVSASTLAVSIVGGDLDVTRDASGATVSATISNTQGLGGGSNALLLISCAQGATSDAYIRFLAGAVNWSIGQDSSASNAFVIANSSALGTTDVIKITTGLETDFVGGNVYVTRSASGVPVWAAVQNQSNTAASDAQVQVAVGGASGGDPAIFFGVSGGANWMIGVDNSDADNLKIQIGNAIDTTQDVVSIDSSNGVSIFKRIISTTISSTQSAMQLGLDGGTQNAGAGPSLLFYGDDSGGAKEFLGRVSAVWEDPTAGSEIAGIQFAVRGSAADSTAQTVALSMLSTKEIRGGQVNGGSWGIQTLTESISTTATPTDSTANLLPANSTILAVTVRVTTGLTGTLTTFTVGDNSGFAATRFASGVSKNVNTTAVSNGLFNPANSSANGPVQSTAAKVRITATSGTLTAGVVEVVVYALVFTPPTS